jgi:hypothetical protein
MSRDRRGDRTQEVIGSIPFSSTIQDNSLRAAERRLVPFLSYHCLLSGGPAGFSPVPLFRIEAPIASIFGSFLDHRGQGQFTRGGISWISGGHAWGAASDSASASSSR